jgi:protein-arginine kinase activator protein McsA
MIQAAKNLDFERAALLRDEIRRLKKEKTLFGEIK